jgi:hypothetical protein
MKAILALVRPSRSRKAAWAASGSFLKVVAVKLNEAYGCGMSRPQKQPLRALTEQEQAELAALARAWGEPAAHVARARALLALSAGATFTEAARAAGRKSGDGVAKLVGRFNTLGLAAVAGRRPSGRPTTPGSASASWPKRAAVRCRPKTARPAGRSRRYSGRCAVPRTGSRG